MERYFLVGAAFCLLLSFGYTLFALGAGKFRPGRFNLVSILLSFSLLTGFLLVRGQEVRSCPLNSLFEVIIFLGWSITLIYLLVGAPYRLSLMGAFTSPLVLILLLLAFLAPLDSTAILRERRDPWVEFHAALSIIAYGAFGLAAVAGGMYLLQERQLKKRKLSTLLYNLPPIADLHTANTRLIWLGFGLLTVAFTAGFVSQMPVAGLKFWTSLGIWALYGVLLALQRFHSLTPHRSAGLSVAIFGFALVTLPGIQYLSSHAGY